MSVYFDELYQWFDSKYFGKIQETKYEKQFIQCQNRNMILNEIRKISKLENIHISYWSKFWVEIEYE